MPLHTLKKLIIRGVIFIFLLFTVAFLINFYILKSTSTQITDLDNLKKADAALLLGAKVYEDESVSSVVMDRIETAVSVYKKGLVKKILISGDHGTIEYDEVNTIKKHLLAADIPEQDVFMDHAGFSTYESVYRAKEIFEVKSLIIITQKFHLPRAIFICNEFGIKAEGIIADRQRYRGEIYYEFREHFARIKAFIGAVIFKPLPKYLGEKIPISGDGRATQD